ncbi:hypothetical protein SEA_NAMAGO_95 [Microbacterium phage Namago]|nr:hypothetical protein SEA_NAMAGO_95 [Microbacterium phage Namago]QQO39602.1 hypothetical protein SEA_PHABIA_93 [Microbacterium phage Phabia]QWY80177.1 hypothetical protein SEA_STRAWBERRYJAMM_99 [Microbacterium phage StrawberryJamm]QWY80477.1 hypothetical protein SEA_TEEHEE_94 [Microbacterium phage Teehee]QXN73488.1 hypothetical protein SEA_JEHOSHAPHAT_95 [Microbacterium phage Jehoshaphat]UVG34044.1 hypothetical protein SEA_WHEELIE_93 [Microbacterium phage Wheelie]UVG34355.1 hypothetical pro
MANSYFDLTIRLANVEMQSSRAVADALREAADQVDEHADTLVGWHGMSRDIRDINGQRVGNWKVVNSRRSTEGYR